MNIEDLGKTDEEIHEFDMLFFKHSPDVSSFARFPLPLERKRISGLKTVVVIRLDQGQIVRAYSMFNDPNDKDLGVRAQQAAILSQFLYTDLGENVISYAIASIAATHVMITEPGVVFRAVKDVNVLNGISFDAYKAEGYEGLYLLDIGSFEPFLYGEMSELFQKNPKDTEVFRFHIRRLLAEHAGKKDGGDDTRH